MKTGILLLTYNQFINEGKVDKPLDPTELADIMGIDIDSINNLLEAANNRLKTLKSLVSNGDKVKTNQLDDSITYLTNVVKNLEDASSDYIKVKDLLINYEKNGEQFLF